MTLAPPTQRSLGPTRRAVMRQRCPSSRRAPCERSFSIFFASARLASADLLPLAGYMQRDLVEERRWLSKQDYVEGLALAQLAPGPLAAQLAIYHGWVRARVLGANARRICVRRRGVAVRR